MASAVRRAFFSASTPMIDDHHVARTAKTIELRRQGLVGRRWRVPLGGADAHAILGLLFDHNLAKITGHVRQHVGCGIADLVVLAVA